MNRRPEYRLLFRRFECASRRLQILRANPLIRDADLTPPFDVQAWAAINLAHA